MKTALFIGRFEPFHSGHLKVIEWILKSYDKVFIVIGSIQESNTRNPFTLEERKEMIDNSLKSEGIEKKKYEIIGIPDVHDDDAWVKSILRKIKFDVVFTNNPWTKKCFSAFNIPVKEHPIFGKISATKIREMIKQDKNWQVLVPKEVEKILEKIDLKKRLG